MLIKYHTDLNKTKYGSVLFKQMGKDPMQCFNYAVDVAKQRVFKLEPYIMKDPYASYMYAKFVIRRRWIEAERVIATDSSTAFLYAKNIIKGRWPPGEEAIKMSYSDLRYQYKQFTGVDVLADLHNEIDKIFSD